MSLLTDRRLRWLWWSRRAGTLSLALRADRRAVIIFALFFGLVLVDDMGKLISIFEQTGDLLVHVCSVIQSMSGTIFCFLALVVGIEIRKHGCVNFWAFIPWKELASHEWTQSALKLQDILKLRTKRRNSPWPLEQDVRADQKETVHGILRAYLPQGGPGVPTNGPGLASMQR